MGEVSIVVSEASGNSSFFRGSFELMGCESRHNSPRVYRRSGIFRNRDDIPRTQGGVGSTMVFKEYTGVFKVPLGSEVAHLYLADKVSLSSSGGAALPEISVLHT